MFSRVWKCLATFLESLCIFITLRILLYIEGVCSLSVLYVADFSPSFVVCHLFPTPLFWAAHLGSGCRDRVACPRRLEQQPFVTHSPGGWAAKMGALAALADGGDPLPGLRTRPGRVLTWPVLAVSAWGVRESSSSVFPSHEVTDPTGRLTLLASGTLIAS